MFLKGFKLAFHKSAAFLFQRNDFLTLDLGLLLQLLFVLFIQHGILKPFDHGVEVRFHLFDGFRAGVVGFLHRLGSLVYFRLGFMGLVVVGEEFLHIHRRYLKFSVGRGA